jgi:hypothetical protein
VLVHAVRTPAEQEVHTLLLGRLHDRGADITTIAWDRGLAFIDLTPFGPVHEIEDINRWRTPQRLARVGLRPVARHLRHRRVRAWWGGEGPPDAVVILGRVREEMRHYVPPGAGPATAVLGWREAEGAESLASTIALADRVLVADAATAQQLHGLDVPATVVSFGDLVASVPAPTPGSGRGPFTVVGLGPGDWRGAPELFLRVAAALPDTVADRPVHFSWLGLDATDGRSFPYLYDTEHLGLQDRIEWCATPADGLRALGRADVVLVTGRAAFPLPVHPFVEAAGAVTFLRAIGTGVAGFETPALDPLAALEPERVRYPDVAELARVTHDLLAATVSPDLDPVVDAVVDLVLGERDA